MSIEEEVVAAAEDILQQTPGGLMKEALAPLIAPHLTNKHLPSTKIFGFLRKQPQRFVEGGEGRWRLRAQAVTGAVLLPVDEPPVTSETNGKAALAAHLRQGCYAVFDLEAIGADARSPATEIIQIAAWRWIDGRPQEASPWSTFARPSMAIPAHIVELTQISESEVRDAPSAREALNAFFKHVGDLPLIAHNGASYDRPLIQATCERLAELVNVLHENLQSAD